MTTHLEAAEDLAILLGPRQADVMRLLWSHGRATVREIYTWLADPDLAYTTIMTTCGRLAEKGLLERHFVQADGPARNAYVYTPLLTEAEFTRMAIEQRIEPVLAQYPALVQQQLTGIPMPISSGSCDRASVERALAYLATLCDAAGRRADDAALDTISALLERAEAAERTLATGEAERGRTKARADAAEQRAQAAERRAESAEQQLENALRQMGRSLEMEHPAYAGYEYRDVAGICRVCGAAAPLASAKRQDDLRVCGAAECRREARRRDSVVKQRRARERRRG